jgi:hypothetical protein
MNNWPDLLFQMLVPLTFFAIWAITALFNRESRGFVPQPPGQKPGTTSGVRPGDPTLRWGSSSVPQSSSGRRVPIGDDDILIIPSDPNRPAKPAPIRSAQAGGPRKTLKGRQAQATVRKPEPAPSRPRLGGVSQNVNQQLARPMDLTPLTTIAPMATSTGSDLANAPSAPSKTSTVLTISTLIPLMNDPMRLREAFIVNELLQRPLALRERRGARS